MNRKKTSEPMLSIAEIFVSVQGEGPSIGKPSLFLRLQGCNLRCSFCDTAQTQHIGEVPKSTIPAVREMIDKALLDGTYEVTNLVITGGEPGVQVEELKALFSDKKWVKKLATAIHTIDVETNGLAVKPAQWKFLAECGFDLTLCVSPKLSEFSKRYKVMNYHSISFAKVAMKLIVTELMYGSDGCVGHLHQLMDTFKFYDKSKIYLQPVDARLDIAQWLVENKVFGCRLSLQIHKIIGVR